MYYFPALLVTLGFCGLRDYGTGEWSGGDADCDHAPPPRQPRADRPDPHGFGTRSVLAAQDQGSTAYRDVCGRCGARRVDSQLGLEATPSEYVERMVAVFREVWRVLRDDGTVWLNLGDSYASGNGGDTRSGFNERYFGKPSIEDKQAATNAQLPRFDRPPGLKPKDLVGIPWRVAFALQTDGWVLRSDIVWSKPNPMPESVTDRPTKSHEYLFLLSKSHWVGAERPMAMRAVDAAWLAALIDGEGSICFQERENQTTANHVGIRLSIVNTNTALLERVREIVGIGGESSPSPRFRNDGSSGRPIYTWQVTNAKAAAVIAAVRPYLIAKATQADLALAGHALNQKHTSRGSATTPSELAAKRRLASACSDINHGREVDLGWFRPPAPGRWVPNAYQYDADSIREPHDTGDRVMVNRQRGPVSADFSRTFGRQGQEEERTFANNPAGRNRRSVWTIGYDPGEEVEWTGKIGQCRVCGGVRVVGNGPDPTTEKATAGSAATTANARPTESSTRRSSDLSLLDSPSTTPARTLDVSTPPISSRSPFATTSCGATLPPPGTPPRPDASTGMSSLPQTLIDALTAAGSAVCVCETGCGQGDKSDVWQVATQPFAAAHFATFPEALVRPCILAGTSERGECSACGAPWVREVERESVQEQARWSGTNRGNGVASGGGHTGRTGQWSSRATETGWRASCTCDAPTRPQTVLDPFVGSGTTALVARNHGRRCIGIDLSAEYLAIAARRLQQLSLLS